MRMIAAFLISFATSINAAASAEPGVTAKEILIGACTDIEGPSKRGVAEIEAAKAYLDDVNEKGGSRPCSARTCSPVPTSPAKSS
ncbi:MAG: hypothetical protein HY078_13120 [Elusimicrobia bacterium]|nr:hypothetical protein [Elusimicrobiota bacterium]